MSKSSKTSLSFIVKLWFERQAAKSLRGHITYVQSSGNNDKTTFTHLDEIVEFIGAKLEEQGVNLELKKRLRFKLSRLLYGRFFAKGGDP